MKELVKMAWNLLKNKSLSYKMNAGYRKEEFIYENYKY